MRFYSIYLIFILIFGVSCGRWTYDDPSESVNPMSPETYLALVAKDTIFASLDSLGLPIYAIGGIPDSGVVWDTLDQAFTTITTSRQEIQWWGEDSDGKILGYYYKWDPDTAWTYTNLESGIFYVPIRTDLDVFSFEVRAVDNDGNQDETPARMVVPIQNSSPQISFRYLSNPQIADLGSDTNFTFPTRTFIWDLYDQDGNETITDIFYTLNDICDTCWTRLDGEVSSITLTEIEPGFKTFYLKCIDIAGAESEMIQFPDSTNLNNAQVWKVKPIIGDVLIVDDYPLDGSNNTLAWYSSMMDTILGENNFSFWEIGDELPYSATDISANLNYFKHIIWYTAYNNTASANDTYNSAEASLLNFIMGGGNLFINPIDFEDTTFTWFPIDSMVTLNPNGRLRSGRVIESDIDSTLNLEVSSLISIKVKGFWSDESEFESVKDLYHMADPGATDGWEGNPPVCSLGQYKDSNLDLSGKVVIMTLPLFDGNRAKLNGSGTPLKFFQYLFDEEFME
ncbi:hypothetical protein OAN76_03505 [Candidatus Marinimicrobia bacterium]|nr:hypothetical protein [Candidatus Neomarinimicrobiota bacterium]